MSVFVKLSIGGAMQLIFFLIFLEFKAENIEILTGGELDLDGVATKAIKRPQP